MKRNFSDIAARIILRIDSQLERLKAAEVRERAKAFSLLGRSLWDLISHNEQTLTGANSSPARRESVFRRGLDLINRHYVGIMAAGPALMGRVARWYTERTENELTRAAGVPLYRRLTDRQIQAIAQNVLIDNTPLNDWWKKQNANFKDAFLREMRAGIGLNETAAQLQKRIMAVPSAPFRDGILRTARNHADTLTRTALAAAANEARLKQYELSPAVKALQHLSTLDNKTSIPCMARSNLLWDKETKAPIGNHNKTFMRPPVHPRCRSALLGVTHDARTLEQMGFVVPAGTQSSMNGQVAGTLDFEDWLRGESKDFQIDQLGRRRWELWQAGRLTFTQLIDRSNRPLTIDQIESQT